VADASTFADGLQAVRRVGLFDSLPLAVQERLTAGARGERDETIKPGDPRLARAEFVLVGSRRDAMEGAGRAAEGRGYHVVTIDAPMVGDVRRAADDFLSRVRAGLASVPRPLCVVATGETTVTLSPESAAGRGGRNQEFALIVAEALPSLGECVFASIGTDGIDGPTDAAGALTDPLTLDRARRASLDPAGALQRHASYDFFSALGDLVITGPTGTNVADLWAVAIGVAAPEAKQAGGS
jgi:glycerate 2-kinase